MSLAHLLFTKSTVLFRYIVRIVKTYALFLANASGISGSPPSLSDFFGSAGTGAGAAGSGGGFVQKIVTAIMAAPLLFFTGATIYTGFMWMLGGSNSNNLSKAQSAFFWSVVGLVVSVLAVLLVKLVLAAIGVDTSSHDPTVLPIPTF